MRDSVRPPWCPPGIKSWSVSSGPRTGKTSVTAGSLVSAVRVSTLRSGPSRDSYTDAVQRPRRPKASAKARRRGHVYFWEGRREHCGAEISVGSGWSSCSGIRDARREICSGAGTAALTAIETEHVHDQLADAVREFRRDVLLLYPPA